MTFNRLWVMRITWAKGFALWNPLLLAKRGLARQPDITDPLLERAKARGAMHRAAQPHRHPPLIPLWLACQAILLAIPLPACSNDTTPPKRPAFLLDEHHPRQTSTTWPRVPSHAEQEALANSDNLLAPDPYPLRSPAARNGGVLRRGTQWSLPNDYLWVTQNYTTVVELNRFVMEPLGRRHVDDPQSYAPAAAIAISRSNDGKSYTVHLRPGQFWAVPPLDARLPPWSGDPYRVMPLTSADYAFAVEMFKDPRVRGAAHLRAWYSELESIEVLDPLSFRLRWRQPGFAAMLWTMELLPLPEHLYAFDQNGFRYDDPAVHLEDHWFRWPIGTGPYKLTALRDSLLRFERFEHYQGPEPALDAIEIIALPDKDLLAQLEADELELIELTPRDWAEKLAMPPANSPLRRQQIHVQRVHTLVYDYLAWNLWAGDCQDKRVRWALAHAVDKERLQREVFFGLAIPSNGPYSSMTPFVDPETTPIAYDPRRASELLEDAGYRDRDGDGWREDARGEALQIRLLAYGDAASGRFFNPMWAELLYYIAQDWSALGVQLQLNLLDHDAFERAQSLGAYDAYVGGWGHFWEDDPYELWHSSQTRDGGANRNGYRSREADRLIESIRAESDPAVRLDLHRRLDRVIRNDQPYLFLFEQTSTFAWRSELRGVRFQSAPPSWFAQAWWLDSPIIP
ncbi:MAG: ABC transporter substrate-binding protein [Myxococcota bacterium]|jgi:ABC-type transport system substrate-binding protein|nr:ABC transporter substrate-binding protein [Myxococcota bacterium]